MILWHQVRDLRNDVGHDDFNEVVEIFMEEVERILALLDPKEDLAAQMHALKGSALNLGFSDFAQLCAEGEKRAAAGEPEAVDLHAVRECFEDSRILFVAQLMDQIRLWDMAA